MPTIRRCFTVLDGALGPVVYRLHARSVAELTAVLAKSLDLPHLCARDVARGAWGGCVVGFEGIGLAVIPGDHAVLFSDHQQTFPAAVDVDSSTAVA